jgi:hypothetical protein
MGGGMVGHREFGMIGIVAAMALAGCETAPAPQGYPNEPNTSGKRPERMLAKHPAPSGSCTVPTPAPTGSEVPGPGEHDGHAQEGKHTSRVVVKDVDVKPIPIDLIEVSPEARCPNCFLQIAEVGKQSEARWVCDAKIHGKSDNPRRT